MANWNFYFFQLISTGVENPMEEIKVPQETKQGLRRRWMARRSARCSDGRHDAIT
jgi:hypothetical protein